MQINSKITLALFDPTIEPPTPSGPEWIREHLCGLHYWSLRRRDIAPLNMTEDECTERLRTASCVQVTVSLTPLVEELSKEYGGFYPTDEELHDIRRRYTEFTRGREEIQMPTNMVWGDDGLEMVDPEPAEEVNLSTEAPVKQLPSLEFEPFNRVPDKSTLTDELHPFAPAYCEVVHYWLTADGWSRQLEEGDFFGTTRAGYNKIQETFTGWYFSPELDRIRYKALNGNGQARVLRWLDHVEDDFTEEADTYSLPSSSDADEELSEVMRSSGLNNSEHTNVEDASSTDLPDLASKDCH